MATFTSTANEAVTEAVSTTDNPSTADENMATLAFTGAEAGVKAASAGDEDVGLVTGKRRSGGCWPSEAASQEDQGCGHIRVHGK